MQPRAIGILLHVCMHTRAWAHSSEWVMRRERKGKRGKRGRRRRIFSWPPSRWRYQAGNQERWLHDRKQRVTVLAAASVTFLLSQMRPQTDFTSCGSDVLKVAFRIVRGKWGNKYVCIFMWVCLGFYLIACRFLLQYVDLFNRKCVSKFPHRETNHTNALGKKKRELKNPLWQEGICYDSDSPCQRRRSGALQHLQMASASLSQIVVCLS